MRLPPAAVIASDSYSASPWRATMTRAGQCRSLMAPLCQCVRQDAGVRIFHIATLADWKQAEADGTYTTSTYGVTLAEAGFLHAARHEQVRQVLDTHYGEVTEPLVVLEIETDLLDVPWREDDVDGVMFPHIYGPLEHRGRGALAPGPAATVRGGGQPAEAAPPHDRERLLRRHRGARGDGRDPGDPGPGGPRPGPRRPSGRLPYFVEFLVWTLAAACGVAAAASPRPSRGC